MAYKLYKDHLYPGWQDYNGKAEVCHFEFKTGPEWPFDWLGQSWYVNKMISSAKESVEDEGGTPLRLTVYRDKAPTWETRYQVVVIAHASPLAWTLVIAGIFALLGLVIAWKIVGDITEVDWGKIIPDIRKGIQWATIGLLGGGTLALVGAGMVMRERR